MNDRHAPFPFPDNLLGGTGFLIAEKCDIARIKRCDRPLEIAQGLTDQWDELRIVAQRICSHPVNSRGIISSQNHPQREGLRGKRTISLSGYHCINYMKDLTLGSLGHQSIGSAV